MRVRFEGIEKKYGDTHAVAGLSLEIADGAMHFLLGPSGCGKTTILRMLAGLETPTAGRIFLDDIDVTHKPAAERGIGMVFQNYALWPHMTVEGNIAYGLKIQRRSQDKLRQRVEHVLELTGLDKFRERLPGQLSGGQQQRVALARALAIEPRVLLLDEPLSNLDAKLRLAMRDNLSRIHRELKVTAVYVTHDQREALSMGTHVSLLRSGHLIQTDSPRRIYHEPADAFVAGFIGETHVLRSVYQGSSGPWHTAVTPWGTTIQGRTSKATPTAQFKKGDRVLVTFRPECVRVQWPHHSKPVAPAQDINLCTGTLDHLTYLGEVEQFHLRMPSGDLIRASVYDSPDHQLVHGSDVSVAVRASDVLIFADHGDLASGT